MAEYYIHKRRTAGTLRWCTALVIALPFLSPTLSPAHGRHSEAEPTSTAPPERLFLQQISPHSAVVKWRGGDADKVCYATKQKHLRKKRWPRCVAGIETESGHMEARLTGLGANRTYYYALGKSKGDKSQRFRTPPQSNKAPRDGNTHIWIIGDSGTATEEGHEGEAAQVLAGFQNYNRKHGNEAVDLFLPLGDTAYVAGTDEQWQGAFFDLYPDILKGAQVLPTIGNHEMGYGTLAAIGLTAPGLGTSSDFNTYDSDGDGADPAGSFPYLNIFSLPAEGESGGVPSGTEQYYSVNYGNVHIVSLDSQLSARDETQRMLMADWLRADLSVNTRDWTIVIFHHPPYSKGANHDSDDVGPGELGALFDLPIAYMREEFTPIFEEYGVDLVYNGHSHSYERSYYLRGHTGESDEFGTDPLHAEWADPADASAGLEENSFEQVSPTSNYVDDRVIYTVAGNGGKADDHAGFSTTEEEWLMHPAHIPHRDYDGLCGTDAGDGPCRGMAVKGSVVVDAGKDTLRARLVDVNGAVLDEFTISR